MEIILSAILLFTTMAGVSIQDPELPDYLSAPYSNRGDRAKFRPLCNRDWGPTLSIAYDKDSGTNEVITVFFNEDESEKSAEWLIATKTEQGSKTVVRCYLASGDKFIFKKEIELHEK